MILFFTDPHIGVARSSNTTMSSAQLLRTRIYDQCMDLLEAAKSSFVVCLGDVVDKHSNPEPIVAQAARVIERCDVVLAGNHDVKNVAGSMSTLGLVHEMIEGYSPIIMNPDLTQPYLQMKAAEGNVVLYLIPHCLTQELFEQSVKLACATAKQALVQADYKVLCLHCNIGHDFIPVEAEGSALTLTDELQELVIQYFPLTMIGHEHTPQVLHGGKIVVMGNLLPLGFGELSNRFTYMLDPTPGKHTLTKLCHFDESEEVKSFSVSQLERMESFGDISYVTIGGEIKPEQYPQLARKIQKLWSNSPKTLMVSNVVQIDRPDALSRQRVDASRQTLVDLVRAEAKIKGFSEELAELEKMQ